jgi:hypothetical protein
MALATQLSKSALYYPNVNPATLSRGFTSRLVSRNDITMAEQLWLMGGMLRGGARTEVSGTALSKMFVQLEKKRPDLLQQSGGDLFKAIDLFSQEFEKGGADIKLLQKTFGTEGRLVTAFKGVMQQFIDARNGVDDAVKTLQVAQETNRAIANPKGAEAQGVKKYMDNQLRMIIGSSTSSIEALKAGTESLGADLFETLTPFLKDNKEGFAEFIIGVKKFIQANESIIQQLTIFIAALAGAGGLIWALTLLTSLNPAVLALAGAFTVLLNVISSFKQKKKDINTELEKIQQSPETKNLTSSQRS